MCRLGGTKARFSEMPLNVRIGAPRAIAELDCYPSVPEACGGS
jgi:hypothetical protein